MSDFGNEMNKKKNKNTQRKSLSIVRGSAKNNNILNIIIDKKKALYFKPKI